MAFGLLLIVETILSPPLRVASGSTSESESDWSSGSDSSRSVSASSRSSVRFGFSGEVAYRLDLLVESGLETREPLLEEPFDALVASLVAFFVGGTPGR